MRTSSTKIFRWNLTLQYTLRNMAQRKGVVFLKLFFFHFIVFFSFSIIFTCSVLVMFSLISVYFSYLSYSLTMRTFFFWNENKLFHNPSFKIWISFLLCALGFCTKCLKNKNNFLKNCFLSHIFHCPIV